MKAIARTMARGATVTLLAGVLLGGCASGWIENEQGSSAVRDVVQAQVLNPTPAAADRAGLDGFAARASIDNYQKAAAAAHNDNTNAVGNSNGGSSGSSSGTSLVTLPVSSGMTTQ